jgi:LacI family transcriptional regulator
MAMGAYRAAAEAGLRIPDDLSIVGFDDQQLITRGLYPELSSVALPHFDMGFWAGETLANLLDESGSEATTPRPLLMPCPLVRRWSVAPV